MDRVKIEDVLMKMGVPAGIKGFAYIADAIEHIDSYGEFISATKELYPSIAKKRSTTPSRVERAIRHAFEVTRSAKGDFDTVEKYIGFMDCTNFNSLVMLHKKIKQECVETDTDCEKEEKVAEPSAGITAFEIREIFRQELKLALNELKSVAT